MATQSRRGRIMLALQKQLQTISKDNGYATSVNEVSFNVKNWRDKTEAECPVLYIVDDRDKRTYGPGRNLEVSWFVNIFGYMRNRTQEEMEEFMADIESALDKNRNLWFEGDTGSNLVNYHRIVDITTDSQMFAEIEGSQLFRVSLEILYTRCLDDAR